MQLPECIPFDIEKEIIKKVSNVKKSLIQVFSRQKHVMPDIPFDIQMEIIKRLPVKPLIRFRSVSKPWKSFIDTSDFIKSYIAQPNSCSSILSYKEDYLDDEAKYICFDDTLFKALVVSPLLRQCSIKYLVGSCHGLLCLYGFHYYYKTRVVVIWNPSVRKSFAIIAPFIGISSSIFGFGVSPVTKDPTIVKLTYFATFGVLLRVEVFTMSSGVWTVIPTSHWPRTSIKLNGSTNVVIDRFIYWAASEPTNDDDSQNHMVLSFDLITKEFSVLDLPKSLTNELYGRFPLSVSKLRESLVVYGCIMAEEALCCGVWVMEHDSSFTKLFTIGANVDNILGFRESGEPIFEARKDYDEQLTSTTIDVYDPSLKQIKNLGIVGAKDSFFMASYKESLLLLDHPDLQIYPDDN